MDSVPFIDELLQSHDSTHTQTRTQTPIYGHCMFACVKHKYIVAQVIAITK